ncbi:MAG: 4Fe-4S binding protein [Oligoflexia bacterium]|nr:4Fe-4S binding protein [Oligoflexia bacterium]
MWLTSKLRQILMVLRAGVVTLKYPFEPRPVPEGFRGAPVWDHHKCIGCGGCADHCPARSILIRDVCQELRVMLYDGSRCTYCGRCADVCPEKAIRMSEAYELACDRREDVTTRLELFMLTCQRCGRCYEMENKNAIDRLSLKGFRYDNLERRALVRTSTERLSPELLKKTDH